MSGTEYSYVVVYSTSHAVKIEKLLNEKGIQLKMVPVPRHISSDCGVCIRVRTFDKPSVQEVLTKQNIEIQGIFQ